ncbi:hypothetical protein [Bartonella ancashensis]|uniref:Uncharacterized protein n=1 Tax=Bartonella ancashensis TaxID=1318743 RepID=A0A0M4LG71_9HYPH|nr:hypothetical protein [Bartonella ancashensis]ALE03369.1 hypothetical protein PU02_0555 [Bartonella ancashensis]
MHCSNGVVKQFWEVLSEFIENFKLVGSFDESKELEDIIALISNVTA